MESLNKVIHIFKRKTASIIVDAAISLPVFIISIAMLVSLIKLIGIEENTYAKAVNGCMLEIEAEAVISGADSLPGVSVRIDENTEIDNVRILPVYYENNLHFSGAFKKKESGIITLAYRPFTGESDFWKNIDSTIVYVFPKSGEKYHIEGCRYLKDGAVKTLLTRSLKNKYGHCKVCNSEKIQEGNMVLIYSGSSKKYHDVNCDTVNKKYDSMSKTEAESRGYSPCRVCLKGAL